MNKVSFSKWISYCKKYFTLFNMAYYNSVNINDFYSVLYLNDVLCKATVVLKTKEEEYIHSKVLAGLLVENKAIKMDIALYNNKDYAKLLMSKMDR